MIKYIFRTLSLTFLLIIFFIFYLTFIGVETSRFNKIIEKQIYQYDEKIQIELKKVNIRLFPSELKLKLYSENANLIFDKKLLKIRNIKSNLPFKIFFSKNKTIENLDISTESNNINDVISFIRLFKNNINTMLASRFINKGKVELNIKLNFDDEGKIDDNYILSGKINTAVIELPDQKKLNTTFNFFAKKKEYSITDLSINYQGIKLSSKKIKIIDNKNYLKINGDISNDFQEFNKGIISFVPINIFNNIESDKINLQSSNRFTFNLKNKFKISDVNFNSKLKLKNLNYKIKNQNLKKIFKIKDKIILSNHVMEINLEASSLKLLDRSKISINGSGEINNNNIVDNLTYNFSQEKKNKDLMLNFKINQNSISLDALEYNKDKKIKSEIVVDLNFNDKNYLNLRKIYLKENNNFFEILNLRMDDKKEFESVDSISLNFVNNFQNKNKLNIIRNKNIYTVKGDVFDGTNAINTFINSTKTNSIFTSKKQSILLDISKFYIDKNNYVKNLNGEINLHKKEILDLKIKSVFSNGERLNLSVKKNEKNHRVTTLSTRYPKPLISRYKFIKGFENGNLDFQSIKKDGKSYSTLIIDNFKVREVPVLAKILTLASLQGIADLLTGDGIRFTDFEMKFTNESSLMEIQEIYAIGPAISLLMGGYVEQDKITSLKGTLVPATTINRTISSIPLIGDILVGKKVGEGVFGVSFKIKGSPNNLKTTVNPIKTLTPRFITRTLEKLKD